MNQTKQATNNNKIGNNNNKKEMNVTFNLKILPTLHLFSALFNLENGVILEQKKGRKV